jgi:hypothetical protein
MAAWGGFRSVCFWEADQKIGHLSGGWYGRERSDSFRAGLSENRPSTNSGLSAAPDRKRSYLAFNGMSLEPFQRVPSTLLGLSDR